MKRIALFAVLAVVAAMGLFASASVAAPVAAGGSHASIRAGMTPATKYYFTVIYDASEYYGPVVCSGVRLVNTKYPNGRDTETCESLSATGLLAHMTAGAGQTDFENTGGGFVGEWESDCPATPGLKTATFTYKVAANLKKFKIVATY